MSVVLSAGLLLSGQIYAQQQKDTEPSTPTPQKTDSNQQKPSEDKTAPKKNNNADDNPFPEDVSRKAAEDAAKQGNENDADAPMVQPVSPGESSSATRLMDLGDWNADRSNDKSSGNAQIPVEFRDPKRAAEDDRIGKFYMDKGNWLAAYNRFKDALRFEPDDADAAYGLAEAASKMRNTPEAIAAYKKCLELDPDGPHSKASQKALKSLEGPGKESSRK